MPFLRSATVAALSAAALTAATNAECLIGYWTKNGGMSHPFSYDEISVSLSIAPSFAEPAYSHLGTFVFDASDVGQPIEFGPGDPGFAEFVDALKNGNDDSVSMNVSSVGGGEFGGTPESQAFGTNPDFAGSSIGALELTMNQLVFTTNEEAGTTSYQYVLSLIVRDGCPSDLNGDGIVGFVDLTTLLVGWGSCGGTVPCCADANDDNQIGFAELTEILLAWGTCE